MHTIIAVRCLELPPRQRQCRRRLVTSANVTHSDISISLSNVDRLRPHRATQTNMLHRLAFLIVDVWLSPRCEIVRIHPKTKKREAALASRINTHQTRVYANVVAVCYDQRNIMRFCRARVRVWFRGYIHDCYTIITKSGRPATHSDVHKKQT